MSSSDVHVQGQHSLQVSNSASTVLTSLPLSKLASVGPVMGFDIGVPSAGGNVFWTGSVAITLDSPSLGITNRLIGQQDLDGSTLSQFRRVEAVLPGDVKTALTARSYTDLRIKIALNVPQGSGPFLLDHFTFEPQLAVPAQPAPSAALDKILGMETLEGWNASAGTLALSSNKSSGKSSLAASGFGQTDLTSVRLSSLGQPLRDHVTVDLWFPSTSAAGSIAAYLSLPSKGISNLALGVKDVGTLMPNAWNRVSFPLDPSVVSKLQTDYSDLQVKLSLNRSSQSGAWLLDSLDFGERALELPPPSEDYDIVIPLPRGKTFDQVALGMALVRRGVSVSAPDGLAATDLTLGVSGFADVAAVRTPANADIFGNVGDVFGSWRVVTEASARVHGSVFAGRFLDRDPASLIAGSVNLGTAANIPESDVGRLHFSFPATRGVGAPDVNVQAGVTQTLPPGVYDDASVTGRLKLRTGSYYFSHISTDFGSVIEIDNDAGPVFVHSQQEVSIFGSVEPTNTAKANVLLTIRGGQASFVAGQFRGTIVAVDNFRLITSAITGSVFGRSVEAAGYVHFVPFKRDDCASQPCGTFGCDAVDTDGDGLFDCQEETDNDPWTDRLIFNGVHSAIYDSSRPAGSCSAIDTISEISAVTAAQQPAQLQDLYAGWDLPSLSTQIMGCPDSYFWPSWPRCSEPATTATGLAIDYSGFLKLAAAGMHCFKVTSGPDLCGSLFLDDGEKSVNGSQGAACFDLPAGVHRIRWFVDKSKVGAAPNDRDFQLAYCFGSDAQCTPKDTLPQSMLRPDYAPGGTCSTNADCLAGTSCVNGTCGCVDDCSTARCGEANGCGVTCNIADSFCIPDTSTCASANPSDANACTADTCEAGGKVRHYFRPSGFPCSGGSCDGLGECDPAGTQGGRGQPPYAGGACNPGLVLGENNGIYFDKSVELDLLLPVTRKSANPGALRWA